MHFDYSQSQLPEAAGWVLKQVAGNKVIALFAPMGAGKTTLSSAIIQALGSSKPATSPTFSIMNIHQTADGQTIYHMDWYRLKDAAEAIDAGVEDALETGSICLVEWPEKAPELLPENCLRLKIEITGEQTRRLSILHE